MFNALFTKTDEYAKLAQALGGPGACALFGIPGSGRAMVYAALAKALDKPLCIVTPGEAEATRFAGDLNALGVAAAVFPARDYVLRPIEGTGREYEYRRLAVLGDLVGGRLQAVCVPDEGLTQYTTPRTDFCANTRSLRPGDTLPRAELTALLYGAGYTRRDQVDGPGQFSIRGDIADIYAPDMKQPARMEFWGDEIDTMHTFDLATQRRDEPIEKIYVSPAREILFGQPADAAENIRSYIKKARGRRRTALETCTAADLAQLDGGAMPVNMDKYLTLRYPEPATILDYFDDPLLILEEPASLREAERATAFRRGEELSALLVLSHNIAFSCVFFSCGQLRVFACSYLFQCRRNGNGILLAVLYALNASDGIGMALTYASAPEGVILAVGQNAVANQSLQAEHTGIPANGNESNMTAFLCGSVYICEMLRNFCVGIKAVHDVEIFCIFRALYRQICRTAATENHNINVVFFADCVLYVIYRYIGALCFQCFGGSSGEESRKLHVGVLSDCKLHALP